jgi:hypothetical protein
MHRRVIQFVILLLSAISTTGYSQKTIAVIPEHAEPAVLGDGWTCVRGYREIRSKCIAVSIPNNAELDVYGHGWTCQRGFREVAGKCVAVPVPVNGELDIYGHGWTCQRAFRDSSGTCIPVSIPQNAELDVYGHGWTCKSGYRDLASKCVPVVVPENAELDVFGHGWTCKFGFKRIGNSCVAMSPAEKRKLEESVARNRERLRRVARANCEIDGSPVVGIRAEIVVAHTGCDYFIADGPSGLYLLEWYGGHSPDVGDVVAGDLNSYGFKDVCYPGYGQGRIWVDDYLLSESSAMEKVRDKCN